MINTFWNFKCLRSSWFLYLPQEGIWFEGLRNDSIVMMPPGYLLAVVLETFLWHSFASCKAEGCRFRQTMFLKPATNWEGRKNARLHGGCSDPGLYPMLLWFWQILHTFYCQLDISYVTSCFSLPGVDEDTWFKGIQDAFSLHTESVPFTVLSAAFCPGNLPYPLKSV